MCAGSYSHNADDFSVEKDSGSHVGSPCKSREFFQSTKLCCVFSLLVHNHDHGSRSPSHSPHSMSPTSHLGDNGMLPPITTASQQYHTIPPISSVGSIPGTEPLLLYLERLTYQLPFLYRYSSDKFKLFDATNVSMLLY